MKDLPDYPENRLDIRMDEQGNYTFQQNAAFAFYYAPTRTEKEEELEALKEELEMLEINEPADLYSDDHDDWEEERRQLEDRIEDLEAEIDEMK